MKKNIIGKKKKEFIEPHMDKEQYLESFKITGTLVAVAVGVIAVATII